MNFLIALITKKMDDIQGAADVTLCSQMVSMTQEYNVNSEKFTKSNIQVGSFFILQEEVDQDGNAPEESSQGITKDLSKIIDQAVSRSQLDVKNEISKCQDLILKQT